MSNNNITPESIRSELIPSLSKVASFSDGDLQTAFRKLVIRHLIRSSRCLRGRRPLGHAKLEGHIARGDPAFHSLIASQDTAEQIIEAVLTHPVRVVVGKKTVDIYNAVGQGVRFVRETKEFQTFLELSRASR